MLEIHQLPALNAFLNGCAAVCLTMGYLSIRRRDRAAHKRWMLVALGVSTLFLTSYVIYHINVGSVPYPHHDWTRPLYFLILIPHVILAAVMTPFIVVIVWLALHDDFARHRKLARYVWPVWMYVSITGVIVYAMLYLRAPPQ